jgi:hypothetical protein
MRESLLKTVIAAILALTLCPASVLAQVCFPPLGQGCSLATVAVSAYTGYFGHRRGADISFSASDQPDGSVQRLRQQFDLQGISAEMLVPVRGGRLVGFAAGFGYAACFSAVSEETVERVAATTLTRTWRAEPQSGNVHANFTLDLHPSLVGLVGFRYENFQANFRDPSSTLTAPSPNVDGAALAFSAYIPSVGLVCRTVPPIPGLNVQFGVVGFPYLLGSVDYRETTFGGTGLLVGGRPVYGFKGSNTMKNGAFVDAFGDVSFTNVYGVQMGAYVKYEYLRAASDINVGNGNPFGLPNVNYTFDFQRRMWGIGGRAAISF